MRHFTEIKASVPDAELIIVNDGSTNGLFQEVQKSFLEHKSVKIVAYEHNKGKGYALRKGVKVGSGDLLIYTDVDFPYTIESFMGIFNQLKNKPTDVAIGIRGEEYYRHLPETRVRISKMLRWLIKTFLRLPTDDTQCGLKGFNQKGKDVFEQTSINRYLFDLEFVFLCGVNKLQVATVEVKLRPEVQMSKMNWKVLLQESGNFILIFIKSIFK